MDTCPFCFRKVNQMKMETEDLRDEDDQNYNDILAGGIEPNLR